MKPMYRPPHKPIQWTQQPPLAPIYASHLCNAFLSVTLLCAAIGSAHNITGPQMKEAYNSVFHPASTVRHGDGPGTVRHSGTVQKKFTDRLPAVEEPVQTFTVVARSTVTADRAGKEPLPYTIDKGSCLSRKMESAVSHGRMPIYAMGANGIQEVFVPSENLSPAGYLQDTKPCNAAFTFEKR